MGCQSILHVANAAVADVPKGGNVPLGTTICQQGCHARLNGDGIALAPGRYEVAATVSMAPAAETPTGVGLSVALLAGGQPVQGGSSTIVSTGAVTLPVVATVASPCGGTTLVVRNTGVDASVSGTSLVVRSLG